MTIKAILLLAAVLAALAGCAAQAAPGQAGQVSTVGLRQHHRAAGCMKVDVYTYGQASQKAALRYWTPARMKSASLLTASGPASVFELLRSHRASSGSRPSELCVHIPVTKVDQSRPTLPQAAKPNHR